MDSLITVTNGSRYQAICIIGTTTFTNVSTTLSEGDASIDIGVSPQKAIFTLDSSSIVIADSLSTKTAIGVSGYGVLVSTLHCVPSQFTRFV
jgi:hypothetical protein